MVFYVSVFIDVYDRLYWALEQPQERQARSRGRLLCFQAQEFLESSPILGSFLE